jgi:hypothetical protein
MVSRLRRSWRLGRTSYQLTALSDEQNQSCCWNASRPTSLPRYTLWTMLIAVVAGGLFAIESSFLRANARRCDVGPAVLVDRRGNRVVPLFIAPTGRAEPLAAHRNRPVGADPSGCQAIADQAAAWLSEAAGPKETFRSAMADKQCAQSCVGPRGRQARASLRSRGKGGSP